METMLTNGNGSSTEAPAVAENPSETTTGATEAAGGGIIEYLEEGDASAEDEPMGEVEYLEDEIPEEEVPRLINETNKEISKNLKDDKVEAKSNEGAEPVEPEPKEKPVAPTKEKEITTEDEEVEENQQEETAEEAEDEEEEQEPEGEGDQEMEEEGEEEGEGEAEVADDEAETILGDEPTTKDEQNSESPSATAAENKQKEEEPVDENQCRVCTTNDPEQLVSLFKKSLVPPSQQTPAELLLVICPSLSIALKDFMPQFICRHCLATLNMAIKLKTQLETTEKDLRKRLSRSKNKVRRPRGYVVIDAPVSSSASDEEEEDDVEFKVSDVANSSSADSDSADSDISEKRKRTPGRPGRPKKKPAEDDGTGGGGSAAKKKNLGSSQGPFECDFCDMSFPRKQSWVLHRKTHISYRNEFFCQICNKRFKVQKAYKTHMERHDQERSQFRCELCSHIFKMRSELKRHMAIKHDEHGVIYECKRCQRTFLTQQRLQRHQSTMCTRYPPQESKSVNQYHQSHQQQQQHHHQQQQQQQQRQQQQKHHYQQQAHSKRNENPSSQGRDLFKSVAPLTTTYWSDSFSD